MHGIHYYIVNTRYGNLVQSYIKNKALNVYNIISITNKTNYAIEILAQATNKLNVIKLLFFAPVIREILTSK